MPPDIPISASTVPNPEIIKLKLIIPNLSEKNNQTRIIIIKILVNAGYNNEIELHRIPESVFLSILLKSMRFVVLRKPSIIHKIYFI